MGELKRVAKGLGNGSSVRDMEALISHKSNIRRQLLGRDVSEQGHYSGRQKMFVLNITTLVTRVSWLGTQPYRAKQERAGTWPA